MSEHIENVKKAIEFKKPAYLPMETLDVPGLYHAYYTLDPNKVTFIPGAENADSLWALGSWFPKEIGKSEKGEVLRKDEWGINHKVPLDMNSIYIITDSPLNNKKSLGNYKFPEPKAGDFYFDYLSKIIKGKYQDRFISAHIDPGAFLVASFLMGTEYLYMSLADNLDFVIEVIEGIFNYHYQLIPKFKEAGCHMVTYLDEFAGRSGMMFSPDIWRKYFKHYYKKLVDKIHENGLYAGLALDGNFEAILDDILDLGIDVLQMFDTGSIGIDTLEKRVKGKRCIKCGVDMGLTLAVGTPDEVIKEATEKVERLNSDRGGYICEVLRWYRPSYPEENVIASVNAFNKFRDIKK